MKLKFYFLLILSFVIVSITDAQVTKVLEPNVGFLDDMIVGDTASNGARVETTYILRRNATYYIQGQFANRGWKLRIKAEDGTGLRPHIQPYAQESGVVYGNMFDLYGDAAFENLFFDGQGIDPDAQPCGRIFRNYYIGLKLDLKGCALANCSQNGIMIPNPAKYVKVEDSQFYNMGRFAFSDFGNGRVFDCRDSEIDTFYIANSTFANMVDRVIRHRGGSGVMKNVIMDHCTIINCASYHGFIELGNIGDNIKITNNLIIDGMGLGNDSTDVIRLSELNAHGELDGAQNPRMVWIGSIPNDTTNWEVSNNIYEVTPAQQAWYASKGINEGPNYILTNHIKSRLGAAAATAFVKKDNVTLPAIPAAMTEFFNWYWSPSGANKQKVTTTLVDYDTKDFDWWNNNFDCKYTTDDADYWGSDNIPVGDANWASVVTTPPTSARILASATDFVAYPNPFTNQITLQFKLDKSADVNVTMFDITGKAVRNINLGNLSSGVNSYVMHRESMNPGVYFLKLDAGTYQRISKIIVK